MNNDDVEKRVTPDAGLNAATVTPATVQTGADNDTSQTNSNAQSAPKTLSGYAVVFNTPSKDLGGFKEVVDPHAFDNVDLSDVYLVNNHDMSQVLASTKAGTLKLNVDSKGLHFDATLPNTTMADDAYTNVAAGNLSAMSFTFVSAADGDTFTKDDSGQVIRTIKQVKSLFDVSLVAIPAYDDTSVAAASDTDVAQRSYTAWLQKHSENPETGKEEQRNMEKTIIDSTKANASRDYENYIRSMGEQRDGLTTTTAGTVVPKEVINDVWDLKESDYDLAKYVTVKQVGTPVGTYPVALVNNGVLATKEEMADIPEVTDNLFRGVDYKVATRAGKIYLSDELVEDSAVDIVAEVKSQLKKLVQNTDNANIISLLTGQDANKNDNFKHITGSTLDDLKEVFNVELDPALSLSVITNQDTYNYLDTLKDSEGRYLLQPSITSPSGKQLFGAPVIVVSNKILATPKAGTFPLIIGDLAQAVFLAQKNEVDTQWERFDSYSQGLAVIIRNDYEVVDPDAARYVEITPAAATPSK